MGPWRLCARSRGAGPRTSSEQGFVDALAAYITDWAALGIFARFFEVVAWMHPLVVMAEVPDAEVPATTCTLQVEYWDVRQGCRALQGEWGMSTCWTTMCTATMG